MVHMTDKQLYNQLVVFILSRKVKQIVPRGKAGSAKANGREPKSC
jgi:hypothetical protein